MSDGQWRANESPMGGWSVWDRASGLQVASCFGPQSETNACLMARLPETAARIQELEDENEELRRRNDGMSRRLCRIRVKVDAAHGYHNESGGYAESAIKGRANGAEGAVDLLIAKYAAIAKATNGQ